MHPVHTPALYRWTHGLTTKIACVSVPTNEDGIPSTKTLRRKQAMPRRNSKPAAEAAPEPTQSDPFEYIRLGLLEIAPICEGCGDFKRGVKIAPLAKEIGVPPVTLSDYLRDGKEVGRVTLTRFVNFLNARKGVETQEQAEAVAEAEALS